MNPPMTFAMPMIKDFVPKSIRPWIYVCIALSFQITGARYLGALNEIIGANSQMREDVQLAVACKKPVDLCFRVGCMIPSPDEVLDAIRKANEGGND